MAGRRGNGEGSVGLRPNGTWRARITDATTGSRIEKYFRLRKEASAWIAQMTALQTQGKRIAPDKTTFRQVADAWLATKAHSVGANTYNKYEMNLRVHVLPDLGDIPMAKAPLHIQDLINKKAAEVAPATVRQIVLVVRQILSVALDRELIHRLPRLVLPKMVERVPDLPTPEQVQFILWASDTSKYGFGLWLELGTGMRRSEMLALNWDDFDELNRFISVTKAVIRVNGDYEVKETKTKAGTRRIDLPKKVCDILAGKKKSGRMFATESGEYLSPWNWQRLWKAWIKRANKMIEAHNEKLKDGEKPVPAIGNVRFHDMRHHYASTLLAVGVAPRVAQVLTGHDDMTTLQQRYTHVMPTQTRYAADKLDEMLPN